MARGQQVGVVAAWCMLAGFRDVGIAGMCGLKLPLWAESTDQLDRVAGQLVRVVGTCCILRAHCLGHCLRGI